jgi:tRNA A-37 threonylcarbamoyl transferase component Bud32
MPKPFELDRDSIEIERLGDGTSFEDFAVAAASGLISENKWVEICRSCKRVIEEFHDLGMIHGDLHAGNIVIVLDTDKGFVPKLIDFAFSSHIEDVDRKLEQLEDLNVQFSQDHDYSQEGDWNRLENGLDNLMREQTAVFSRGIRALFS